MNGLSCFILSVLAQMTLAQVLPHVPRNIPHSPPHLGGNYANLNRPAITNNLPGPGNVLNANLAHENIIQANMPNENVLNANLAVPKVYPEIVFTSPNMATFNMGDGFSVTSGSPGNTQGFGIRILADALEIGGTLAVNGQMPIFGTVTLNGNLPTDGAAAVNYGCGSPSVP